MSNEHEIRERGQGRLFRPVRKDKRTGQMRELPFWQIAYSGPKHDGTWGEIRESARTSDRRVAGKLLRDRLRKTANHRLGVERFVGPGQDRVTVSEIIKDMVRDAETRGLRSVRTTKAHVAHLTEYFGHDLAVTVTADRIRRYIATRKEQKAAPGTIDRETEKLNRAFSLAVQEGKLAFRPAVPKLLRPNENARQGFVEKAQLETIKANLDDPDVVDLVEWLATTGMRKGEALSLSWESFDRETWTLRLPAKDAKTGHGRVLALEGVLKAIIERRIAARRLDVPRIFHRRGHARRSERFDTQWGAMGDFSKLWRAACKKAGVPALRLHDLRRSAVRNLIRAGVGQAVAMAISGHETEAMFRRYNITNEEDLREAARRITSYLSALPTAPIVEPIPRSAAGHMTPPRS
jgi:integrase